MRRASAIAAVAGLFLAGAWGIGAEPPKPAAAVPADFKLVIGEYGAAKEPVGTLELIFRRGMAYQFSAGPLLEVIIHDPSTQRVELVDLNRKLRTEVTEPRLETYQTKLHDAIAAACAKREKQGGRANEVAATMSRRLIDPNFTAAFDTETRQLRLTNPTVEVEARGDPEPDAGRLTRIGNTLVALIRLESMRDPQAIPPFARLETLHALTADHRLRPSEISILYRLAGRPQRNRWTFTFVPKLTDREVEAIARLTALMDRCQFIRFERYKRANPSP
jgi:hypothetical protein